MPLDTSIPLQIGRAPQTQTFDPMTLYNAMQDRQTNALRSRLIEQEMAQNALTMQNTLEDRRLAAATRAQAAAQAAEERRRQAERLRIVQGGYRPEKNVVIGPGTIQGSAPAGYDFAGVTNALLQRGDVDAVENLSKLQQQIAGQQKAEAEVPGIRAESRKKETEAKVAELDAAVSRYIPAVRGVSTPDDAMRLTDALYADPTLGPLLSRVAPLEQARTQAAREFAGDPMGFMRRHLLTGKELYDATVAAKEIEQPKVTVLPPGSVATDLNPNSPTYGQPIAKGEPAKKTEIEAKAEIKEEARKGTDTTLDRLFNAYTKLNEMGAMPSEAKSWLGNIPAKLTTSVIGQTANIDPKAQTQIQTIKGLRQDLIRDIKNATGMSAQEMNSNVELQSLLDAATDPNQNIESVLPRLADFSQRYGTGKLASNAPKEASANAETKSTFASEAEADAYFTQRGAKSGDKFKVTIGGQSGTYVVP